MRGPHIPPPAARGALLLAGALMMMAPAGALAQSPPAGPTGMPAPLPPDPAAAPNPLLGPGTRYADRPVIPRVLSDLPAVLLGVGQWDGEDWGRFLLVANTVGFLMLPLDPSPDAALDRWITRNLDAWVPDIWVMEMQAVLWGGMALTGFGTWWWASATGRKDIAQGMSLMGEALAVSQFFHVAPKLLLGREGPTDGEGRGEFKGPSKALDYYPAGTPSGHAGTLFVALSVGVHYFQPPTWVRVAGLSAASGLMLMHVVNHRHYLSEIVWGAALGWSVGAWVVRHRASWRPYGQPGDLGFRVALAPTVFPGGGQGLALVGRF